MVHRLQSISPKKALQKNATSYTSCFSKLRFRKPLVDSAINKLNQEPDKEIHTVPSADPCVYLLLPFKDQRLANRVLKGINSLGSKVDVHEKPVFTSKKLSQTKSVKEKKPPIVNTQCVIYLFQCDLSDANCVGYAALHLHQRICEHCYSSIGKHIETDYLFKVLRKCNSKFDCFVYEILCIKDIKPSLNTRDTFVSLYVHFFLLCFLPWELYSYDPQIFYVSF